MGFFGYPLCGAGQNPVAKGFLRDFRGALTNRILRQHFSWRLLSGNAAAILAAKTALKAHSNCKAYTCKCRACAPEDKAAPEPALCNKQVRHFYQLATARLHMLHRWLVASLDECLHIFCFPLLKHFSCKDAKPTCPPGPAASRTYDLPLWILSFKPTSDMQDEQRVLVACVFSISLGTLELPTSPSCARSFVWRTILPDACMPGDIFLLWTPSST